MEKKYEMIDGETKILGFTSFLYRTLHRIGALKDFGAVRKGDLGGWIESEENLSQTGDCWIFNEAKVYENARVSENAKVFGAAIVRDNANMLENSSASENAVISGTAILQGNASVRGHAMIVGSAKICGNASIYDGAVVGGDSIVCGDVSFGKRIVLKHDAVLETMADYLLIGPMGSRNDTTAFYKTRTGIAVTCGCFSGTLLEFERKVLTKYNQGHRYRHQYLQAIAYAEKRLDIHRNG